MNTLNLSIVIPLFNEDESLPEMVKFGAAFAGLLSGLILAFVGFDQTLDVQRDEALAGLRAAFIIVPSTGTVDAPLGCNHDQIESHLRWFPYTRCCV